MGDSPGLIASHLGEQVAIIASLEVPVRTDEFDAVHRMRVAARRIQAALRVWRPLLDAREVDLLRCELRWLAHALAAARDAEVMEGRLDQALAGDSRASVAAREVVDVHLDAVAARARAELDADLASERWATLMRRLERCASDPPLLWDEPRFDTLVDLLAAACARAWHAWRELPSARPWLGADDPRHEQAHLARRRAKVARYLAEAVAAPGGVPGEPAPGFDELALAFKLVSDELGTSHDAVVAARLLVDLAADAPADVRGVLLAASDRQLHLAEESLTLGDAAFEEAHRLTREVLARTRA